ncbi:MAG TPA: cyclic nucleotide-binding domain-containing protein [Polyangia bacterium]|jgi:CRP-like cAMP-binding protein
MAARPIKDVEQTMREHRQRALAYIAAGKTKPALAEYRGLLELAPGDVGVRQKVAELAWRLGQRDEALQEYQRVVDGYAAAGHLLKAIAICKVIRQLAPGLPAAEDKLRELCARECAERGRRGATGSHAIVGALGVTAPPPAGAPDPARLDPAGLPATPLFSELPREALAAVLGRLALRTVPAGQTIVAEGEPGDSMFIVVEGSVEVWRRDPAQGGRVALATLTDGAFFGEMALVTRAVRFASVTAVADSTLLELTRAVIDELAATQPTVATVIDRFYKERLLADLLGANPIFRLLPPVKKRDVVEAFAVRYVPAGTVLCAQGQPGAGLFVILRGACRPSHAGPDGVALTYPDMVEGDLFGELSLISGRAATATVRAATDCVLLHMAIEDVQRLVLSDPAANEAIRKLGGDRLSRTFELLRPYGVEAVRRLLV